MILMYMRNGFTSIASFTSITFKTMDIIANTALFTTYNKCNYVQLQQLQLYTLVITIVIMYNYST